jgi:DNA-directed RNA polymerase specialized sigma24 family protein
MGGLSMKFHTSGQRPCAAGSTPRVKRARFRGVKDPSSPEEPAPAPRRFVTTRWSLVLAAGHGAAPEMRKALSELCALYWYPLYAFVRGQSIPAEQAKDLTQGFFTRLLEKNALAVAEPGRGRFRAWLLACLKHYLLKEWAYDRAEKRGGDRILVGGDDGERLLGQERAPGLTPDRAFDRCWALTLLAHVLAKLRDEYVSRGKGLLFDKLKRTLTGEEEGLSASLAAELGMSRGAVNTQVCRLRKRYQELTRQEISRTVKSDEDVDIDDELQCLLSALKDE